MQVFVATHEQRAFEIDAAKMLTLASLGLPQHIKYLPLKETRDAALDAAITGNALLMPMARRVTVWRILEVHVPEATAFQMVHRGEMVRQLAPRAWRLYGDLDYSGFTHCWCGTTRPPVGVVAWAQNTLMPRFQVSLTGTCCRCQKRGAVWREHCGDCWLDWLQETQTNNTHMTD